MSKRKAFPPPPPSLGAEVPDRSPVGLRATAARIDDRKESGFFVPGSAVSIYAEALRALAREREQGQE